LVGNIFRLRGSCLDIHYIYIYIYMYWRRGLVVVRFGLLAVFIKNLRASLILLASSGGSPTLHITLIVGLVRKTPMVSRIP